ncbi:MAG: MucB/RseB C-terminal domain-containing protein [Succinivibrionaceae bacterium]|nr:MucB/RseB C-terminal domain-containing protein [Succinivibrionaceae bacterium]
MYKQSHRLVFALLAALLVPSFLPAATASENESAEFRDAESIISRCEKAHRSLPYENYVVHITLNGIESLRVSHGFVDSVPTTLMQSLNGLPNGVVNFNRQIVYVESDDKFYSVGDSYFPNIFLRLLNSSAAEIRQRYDIYSLGQSRVADLIVDMLKLVPADGFGYNLLLAVDQDSGLVVQLDVSDVTGSLVERFMTVNLNRTEGNPSALTDVIARIPSSLKQSAPARANETLSWKLGWLPDNFFVVRTNRHAVFGSDASSEYMMISNKFTDISIYLTSHVTDISVPVLTLNATTIYRQRISENLDIAVIGQIPPDMARTIAQSIVLE